MVRRVFFSFDYDDIWRVSQVRNHAMTKTNTDVAGYFDAAKWEKVKKQTDEDIKRWINNNLENTSVTVILIGSETSKSKWVEYEIKQSFHKQNGLIGIYIHNLKDQYGNKSNKGKNPLDNFYVNDDHKHLLSMDYNTYDWVCDNGYNNFKNWIENSAKEAKR